jgi:hypothetical protein
LPARRRSPLSLTLLVGALLALTALLPSAALAAGGTLKGYLESPGMKIELMQASPGAKAPVRLGSDVSRRYGYYTIHYSGEKKSAVKYLIARRTPGSAEAGAAVPASTYVLGAALGSGALPNHVVVDERTTVAMGFAMAEFIGAGDKVSGPEPGLANAAAMTGNLENVHGEVSKVLGYFPNGESTSAEATFGSLADLLATCSRQGPRCAAMLALAGAPGEGPAPDTLAAAVDIARNPWHHVRPLFRLALKEEGAFGPSLAADEVPDAWTLALRFEGSPPGLDGPGNFSIDPEGNLWVANNYAYSRESRKPACGSDKLFRFTPTGRTVPGSPYTGGGLSGVGFGVAVTPSETVWASNFGFEGKGCKTAANHTSISAFNLAGETLSPEGGWEVGGISWPQGTVVDGEENVWVANCGNDSVTKLEGSTIPETPEGPPPSAEKFGAAQITAGSSAAFERPFADALDAQGNVFVTGNASNSVAELSPSGQPLGTWTGGGLHLPMGIVVDDNGYAWVSNSRWVVAPCPGKRSAKEVSKSEPKGGGDVTLIKPKSKAAPLKIEGAGLRNPWGITVDGDDHVWVANFGGRRLSELCGSDTKTCPPGKRSIGAAISPPSGYGFDGLVRNTGVIVDPSGNVWLANNWKNVPIQSNPGGYQIVAYLGLAAPVAAPAIGPPAAP